MDEITYMKNLHTAFHLFLKRGNYELVSKMMDSFSVADKINEIKTILIIVSAYEQLDTDGIMSKSLTRLNSLFDNMLALSRGEDVPEWEEESSKIDFASMTNDQAIDYCYLHRNDYIKDFDNVDEGIRQFDCLIAILEDETISPTQLPEYGMDY